MYLSRLIEKEGKTDDNNKAKEILNNLISLNKDLSRIRLGTNYKQWQTVSEQIFEHAPMYDSNTLIYIESLLRNGDSKKANQLLKTIETEDSENKLDFIYLKGLMYYFEGK